MHAMSGAEILTNLQFVLGGARSGKSSLAEGLARSAARTGGALTYVATAQAYDTEMEERIAQHVVDRGPDWNTIEAPLDLKQVVLSRKDGEVVLIDCLTLWLSNILLANRDVEATCSDLVEALSACRAHVVCVSNDVGMGLVPDNSLGRRFRDAQGRLNQMVAARAGLAVLVVAGLPLVLKGNLPPNVR